MINFSPSLDAVFHSAFQHHQAGRLAEAEVLYRQILQQNPRHADALHFLGLLASQVQRRDIAVNLIRQAIALKPNFPEALSNLGNILKDEGRLDEAIAAHRQAIALQPDLPEAHYNLGVALGIKGQLDEAISAYRQAVTLKPELSGAYYNLGVALGGKGQIDEAIAAYHQTIALQPNFPEAYYNLGVALSDKEHFDEAISAFRQAIILKPDYREAVSNLGNTLNDKSQFDEAIAAYRQAAALNPELPETHYNLGVALGVTGQLDEAIATLRQAIDLNANLPIAHSCLLYTLHLHPGYDAEAIAEEHRRWNRQHAAPLKKFITPHGNVRNPERRLRLGYVSPDFREHAVAPMVLPLLANHDHSQFEVFCYAQVGRPDGMTARFRDHADHWRNTVGWSDQNMAAEIRKDQIDILVDLAGHTGGNRLLVFARKPAPLQVARQGYPDTTGLETIDYRMTDEHADPPGLSDSLHSETLIRLPRTNWIYQPSDDAMAMAVTPHALDMPITFGCFNHFAKVTEPMLRLWAEIIAVVPGSRILLKAQALATVSVQQRVRAIFAARGLSADRVEINGWRSTAREHLQQYNRVTIALDPFPYHGTTTTCEALWMGVPVITLAGRTHVSRVGVSLLRNIGLPELIAQSADEYVRLATGLAADRPRLVELRSTLRQRMVQSPLMDGAGFASNIELEYRRMWRKWCAHAPLADDI